MDARDEEDLTIQIPPQDGSQTERARGTYGGRQRWISGVSTNAGAPTGASGADSKASALGSLVSPRGRAGPKTTKVTPPSVTLFLSSMGIVMGEESHIVDKEVNEVAVLRREHDTIKNANAKKEAEVRRLEEEIETLTATFHSRASDGAQLKSQAFGIENKSATYESKLEEELSDRGVYTHMIQRLTSEALVAKKATLEREKQLLALQNELASNTTALLAARQEKSVAEGAYKQLYQDWWEKKQENVRALGDMQQAVQQTRLKFEILEQREVSRKKHVQEAIGEIKMKESRRLRHESCAQMSHFSDIQEELSETDLKLLAVETEFKRIIEAAGTNEVDKIIAKFVNRDETLRALKEEHAVADARMRKLRDKHKQLNEQLGQLRSSAINTRTIYQEMDQTSERLKDIEKDASTLSDKFNRSNVMMDAFRACMLKCLSKLITVHGSLDYDDHSNELSRAIVTPTSELLHLVEQKLNRVLDVINREKAERELHRSEATAGALGAICGATADLNDKHAQGGVRAPAPSESEEHFILRMSSPNTATFNVRVRPKSQTGESSRAPAMSVVMQASAKHAVSRRPQPASGGVGGGMEGAGTGALADEAPAPVDALEEEIVIDRLMRKKLVGLVVNRGKRGRKAAPPQSQLIWAFGWIVSTCQETGEQLKNASISSAAAGVSSDVFIMAGSVVQLEEETCQCGHSHHHRPVDDADARVPPTKLVQQLWMPWRAIVLNPVVTALAYVIFNLLFILIWLLVSLLIWLLTLPGLLLVIVLAAFFGLRLVAQYVSYPGQLSLVVRDGEANFARLTKRRLTMALDAAQELVQTLRDSEVAAGSSPHRRIRFLQHHQNFEFSIETLVVPLLRTLELVEKDGNLGLNGSKLLAVLQDFTKFTSHELAKYTAELSSASAKDFDLRRQQLFLMGSKVIPPLTPPTMSTSASASPSPPSSTLQHQWVPGSLLTTLEDKLARIREVLPLVGAAAASAAAKRDLSWAARELCQRKPADVDIITTLDLIRADLIVRFHGEQVWISSHNNHQIDAMFIPAAGGFSVDKPVMILCNPNGGLYEFHHFQMDWIKFYTELQCHVMLFNYRGYGRNSGSPSPWAHNLDAMAIVEFLKLRKKIKKIGVHGESIGGLVATFLARSSDAVQVLVADRTFANLPALAQRLVASWAGRAVSWLTWWETDNAGNYLAARCPKLLCSDPNDDIILDGASLKSGVALRVELGDEAFDLPRPVPLNGTEQAADPNRTVSSWLADLVPFWSKCAALASGEGGHVRRQSEASTRPQLGLPLSEAAVRRFSESSLSLGRRAMRFAERRESVGERSTSGDSRGSGTSSTHVEISVGDTSSGASSPRSASFPLELLAVVWMQLASLDGYCGHCFLQAAESGGFDRIRAWTVSMLTWGGQLPPQRRTQLTLEAFDRQGLLIRPLTIFQVHQALQTVAEEHPSVKYDVDVGVVIQMIEYIMDSLQRRWKLQGEEAAAASKKAASRSTADHATSASLGRLLPLHCGHNRQFADNEKAELVAFLRSAAFLVPEPPSH